MSRLGALVDCHDLPLAELCAARIDGDLWAVGRGFAPLDAPDDRHLRARTLTDYRGSRLIADRVTAAWVHGACSAPVTLTFCHRTDQRSTVIVTRDIDVREIALDDRDLMSLEDVALTTPDRTARDLALDSSLDELHITVALCGLARADLVDLRAIAQTLEDHERLPHKRRALRRIECARLLSRR